MKAYENIMRFDLNLDIFFLERERLEKINVFFRKKRITDLPTFSITHIHTC